MGQLFSPYKHSLQGNHPSTVIEVRSWTCWYGFQLPESVRIVRPIATTSLCQAPILVATVYASISHTVHIMLILLTCSDLWPLTSVTCHVLNNVKCDLVSMGQSVTDVYHITTHTHTHTHDIQDSLIWVIYSCSLLPLVLSCVKYSRLLIQHHTNIHSCIHVYNYLTLPMD